MLIFPSATHKELFMFGFNLQCGDNECDLSDFLPAQADLNLSEKDGGLNLWVWKSAVARFAAQSITIKLPPNQQAFRSLSAVNNREVSSDSFDNRLGTSLWGSDHWSDLLRAIIHKQGTGGRTGEGTGTKIQLY